MLQPNEYLAVARDLRDWAEKPGTQEWFVEQGYFWEQLRSGTPHVCANGSPVLRLVLRRIHAAGLNPDREFDAGSSVYRKWLKPALEDLTNMTGLTETHLGRKNRQELDIAAEYLEYREANHASAT